MGSGLPEDGSAGHQEVFLGGILSEGWISRTSGGVPGW